MNKIYVVGIGPGEYEQMTIKAVNALNDSDIIVGYTVYTELVKPHFENKEFFSTAMLGEVERCQKAVGFALEGKTTAVVCSGDAGIYGMSSLVYQLAEGKGIEIVVVSGVTAASSGASVLGAPLGHDFSIISLSDLLTPFDLIKSRVEAAAKTDMCMAIYNPSSKKRGDYLSICCDIMLKHQKEDVVCGIVRNIGREDTSYQLLTLKELRDTKVDMFTTVFIGNSSTLIIDGKMVTPRGYKGV